MTDGAEAAAAETTEETGGENEIETKAREQGWRPKDEWTGKPEHWKDAATYVEHGDLKARLKATEDTLSRVSRTTEAAIDKLKKGYEKEIADLKEERKAAIKKGDADAVEALDGKIDDLKDELKDEVKGVEAKADDAEDDARVQAAWVRDNPYFETNEEMSKVALTYSNIYAKKHPKSSLKENLEYVTKMMKEDYPNYAWGKKAPAAEKRAGANGHASVDGGGFGAGAERSVGKGVGELPPEAKEIGAGFVKQGLYKDMTAYAKEYWKNA